MAKQWEADFRYPAVQASIALAGDDDREQVFDCPFSFCLPVSERPIVTWITPGRITLLFLILGFAGLIGGAVIASIADDNKGVVGIRLLIALTSSISGFFFLSAPSLFQKQIISWCIGDRGGALLSESDGSDTIYCELGDSANPKISIDGDDHVLVLFDQRNRRLLIEGIAASYQIRSQDIVSIEAFEFMNYLGADIVFRIDDHTQLRVGLARSSLLKEFKNQMPPIFFVDRCVKNRILDETLETLGTPAP